MFTPLSPLMSGLLQGKSTLGKTYMPVDVNAVTVFWVIPLKYPERKNYGSRVLRIVVYVNLTLPSRPAHFKVVAERGPNTLTPKFTDALESTQGRYKISCNSHVLLRHFNSDSGFGVRDIAFACLVAGTARNKLKAPHDATKSRLVARWLSFDQQIQTGCAWQLMITRHQASFHTG